MAKVDEKKFSNFMFHVGSVGKQAYNPRLFDKKTIEYQVGGEKVSKTIYVRNNITIREIEAKAKKSDGKLVGPFKITYSDGFTEEKAAQKEFLEKLEESKTPNWYKKNVKSYDKIEEYSASYDDNGNLLGLYPESYSFYLKLSELAKNSEEFEKIKNDSRMAYHFLFKFGEDKAKAQHLIGRLKQDNKNIEIEKEKLNGKIKRLEYDIAFLTEKKQRASDRIRKLNEEKKNLERSLVEANLGNVKNKELIETLEIKKKEIEAKLENAYDEIKTLKTEIDEKENKFIELKRKHNLALKKRGKAIIALTAVIAVLAAGAGHHIAKLINASQSKDSIINDKDQIINDKDEIIENELQSEDWVAFKGFLENKLGGKILLYADDEGMAGSMRVYFEKDGNLCMKSYKLPEGINDFDGFNRPTLEQFKNDINSDKVEVFDEFSFSKTEKREISVNGMTYNLNGMTDASDITKNLLTINEGESSKDYIARCNGASVVISDPIIVNQYDNQKNIIGKKVTVNAFVGSQDETVDAKMIQKEKYYSEAEVANMSKADLIAKTLEEGRFVELENSNGYNFLPRLTIVSATNDIKDSINDYTDPQEIKKLNIELQSAGIIKIGESVVSKVAESGDIKYLRITDLAKRDCLYAVKYTNSKPVSAEKYISLNNYTTDADARDVLMYSLTGNFFDRFGSEDKTMYVKSSISTNSSNEYNGKLDIVCVGYSSDNPIAMEKKGLVEVKSNDKLNIQKLVDVVIAKINNEKCPVKGAIKYSLTSAKAIENEEDLVEVDGQIMTTKELTNSLIDERII